MLSTAPTRPAISAMVIIIIALVALLGQGALEVLGHTGDPMSAPERVTVDHPPRGHDSRGQDTTVVRDDVPSPCLHNDACAGGGALNLGDNTFGVIPETVGTPVLPQSDVTEQGPLTEPVAPTLTTVERPPQAA